MKVKQVYQTVLGLSGLFFLIAGVGCVVAATLVDQDDELSENYESRSRTYGTQYWLGIPLIFYGIILIAMAAIHKSKKLITVSLFLIVPMIIFSIVGSILHGTSFAHFMSMESHQSYLKDTGYTCQNLNLNLCHCTRSRDSRFQGLDQDEFLRVPCDKQNNLVTSHGAIFSFGAISFGLLFGILFINIVFLLPLLNFQLPVNYARSAENHGFSHQGDDHQPEIQQNETQEPQRHQNEPPLSQNHPGSHNGPSQSHEPPPSYDESLLTSFVVTAQRRNVGRNSANVVSRRPPDVNYHATVHYRGELNSRAVFPGSMERGLEQQTAVQESNNSQVNNQRHQHNSEQRSEHEDHGGSIPQEECLVGTNEVVAESNSQNNEQLLDTHGHLQDNQSNSSGSVVFHNSQSLRSNVANGNAAVSCRGQSNSNTRHFTEISSENSPSHEAMQQDNSSSVIISENTEHNVHQLVQILNEVERRRDEHDHAVIPPEGVSDVAAEVVTEANSGSSEVVVNEQSGSSELLQHHDSPNVTSETRTLPNMTGREPRTLSQCHTSLLQLGTSNPDCVVNMEDIPHSKPCIEARGTSGTVGRSSHISHEDMFDTVVDV